MKAPIVLLSLALSVIPLTACAEGTYGRLYVGNVYPYSGYYDGFYGPIYDGYWGTNGSFYYRLHEHDGYRRGDHDHFRRDGTPPPPPDGRFRPMQGETRPQPDVRMPHFDGRQGRPAQPDRDRTRDRD